jgi:hypothetical protein
MRRVVTSVCCTAALVAPVGNAFAVARTVRATAKIAKVVVNHITVDGPVIKCHRWGFMEVRLNVIQTEKIVGTKKTVSAIKITSVSWPIFPNHTPRSTYINTAGSSAALPLLQQETLQLQGQAANDLVNISGASNTTVAWLASLTGALVKAETPAK